jgi:hypothetical protein
MLKRLVSYTLSLIHALYTLTLASWVRVLPVTRLVYSLAIVRRYTDANGSFVGELYLLGSFAGVLGYQMIGVSLDTLPFDCQNGVPSFDLDTEHHFLDAMPVGCVRVGATDPQNNDAVRENVARLAKTGRIELKIQNRFIEHVMQSKKL